MNPNANLGLRAIMMCQCSFISSDKCSSLVKEADGGGVWAHVGYRGYLHVFLSVLLWTLNRSKIREIVRNYTRHIFVSYTCVKMQVCPHGDIRSLSVSMKKLLLCCLESLLLRGAGLDVCASRWSPWCLTACLQSKASRGNLKKSFLVQHSPTKYDHSWINWAEWTNNILASMWALFYQ